MAIRIEEIDVGSNKPATQRKYTELKNEVSTKWEKMMAKYWTKVYENTIQAITDMGAVDTGSLRQSIRIEVGKTIVPGLSSTGLYEIARTDVDNYAYIIAGGGGIINPRHKREVDYAQAVHDGHFTTKKQKIAVITFNRQRKKQGLVKMKPNQYEELGFSEGYVPGRPFLDEGINRTEAYLEQLLREYMDGKVHTWMSDQPLVSPYSVSMIIKPSKYR